MVEECCGGTIVDEINAASSDRFMTMVVSDQ